MDGHYRAKMNTITMDSLCKLALECIDFNRKNRPKTMRDVLLRLHAIQSAWCAQLQTCKCNMSKAKLGRAEERIAEMEQMLSNTEAERI